MREEQFATMIAGLEASGVSRAAIARECNLSRMTVWRLAEGVGTPRWPTGQRIQELYFSRVVTPVIQNLV